MMKHIAALLAISLILLPIAGCCSAGDIRNSPDTSAAIPEDMAAMQPMDETDKNANPWVVDGKLRIGSDREAFLDIAKQLHDNGYTNNTVAWRSDDWFNGMRDAGPKKVFGYFGPLWLVNYTIKYECGGEKPGEGTYGDWAVCEPPVGFFRSGYWVFVNKNSEYKEALGDLVRWITLDGSETGFQYSLANGTFPGNERQVKDKLGIAAEQLGGMKR